MTPEEREKHIQELTILRKCFLGEVVSVPTYRRAEALTAAISALEREGQMEARLRWIAKYSGIEGFSTEGPDVHMLTWDVQIENGTEDKNLTEDESFAGFCHMVDKAMEASDD